MHPKRSRDSIIWGLAVILLLSLSATAKQKSRSQPPSTVRVVVTDALTGEPLFQAHLTLRFLESGGPFKRSKINSYSAKTDKKGEYSFMLVPKGTITLMVTAPGHETFGKEFEVKEDNQLIEVKMKKPQEVL